MSVIGVDVGTSGARAVAFGPAGEVRAVGEASYALLRPAPGRVELDPMQVIDAVELSVRRAAAGCGEDPVRALSLSTLGEAVLPIDDSGRPSAPLAVSMDDRGAPHVPAFERAVSGTRFAGLTGQPMHRMFSAFKLMAGGDGWENASGFRCAADLFAERWTGIAAIDASSAARTGLLDVGAGAWSPELLDAASERAPWIRGELLSDVRDSGEVIGRLTADAAERLGLPSSIPLVAGAHDQAAAFLGAGGRAEAVSVISFGSSDCFTVGTRSRPQGAEDTGFASYRVGADLWVTLAGTAAGGWALEWFSALLRRDVGELFGDIAAAPPALLMLPYLAGSGTLDNDPDARGVLHGLRLETTVPEIARAVIEAAGFEFHKIRAALDRMGIDAGDVRVTGSGASNGAALRARANACGFPLTPAAPHAAARGAAMLALDGLGEDASALVHDAPSETAAPDPPHSDWYARQRSAYVDLYTATLDVAHHLASPLNGEGSSDPIHPLPKENT